MKTIVAMLLLVAPALAGDCRPITYQKNQLTVVPYAVAVAVPVAAVTPGAALYSYKESAPPQQASHDPEYQEFLQWKAGRSGSSRAQASSLVTTHCASCHTGRGSGVDFFDLSRASCEDLRRAAAAVAKGAMPKGARLSGEEVGKLAFELSTMPAVDETPEPSRVTLPADEYQRYRAWADKTKIKENYDETDADVPPAPHPERHGDGVRRGGEHDLPEPAGGGDLPPASSGGQLRPRGDVLPASVRSSLHASVRSGVRGASPSTPREVVQRWSRPEEGFPR